jgi:hypothetical protein
MERKIVLTSINRTRRRRQQQVLGIDINKNNIIEVK